MKGIVLLIIGLTIATGANAQQRAVYSNFMMSDYYHNPAIAGSKLVHIASVSYRKQWVGFDNAPSLLMANFYGSVKNKGKMGYGVSVVRETLGLTDNTSIYLNYAHHFKLSETLKLGLGVKPGYMSNRMKLYEAYPTLADNGDDVLTNGSYNASAFDLSAGFNLYSDKFFVMGAFHHLIGKGIGTSYNGNLVFHYNAIAGYNFKFKKKNIELQPSVMVNAVSPLPLQYSTMIKTSFNNKYWFGVLFKGDMDFKGKQYPSNSVGLSLGANIKERFMVSYGYDYTLSKIRSYQAGSHEVMLSFIITKKKPTLNEEDDKLNNSIMEELKKNLEEKEKEKNQ